MLCYWSYRRWSFSPCLWLFARGVDPTPLDVLPVLGAQGVVAASVDVLRILRDNVLLLPTNKIPQTKEWFMITTKSRKTRYLFWGFDY